MTAEEFFDKNIKDLDGKETKNSLIFFYKESIVNSMKEFAKLKCKEQRQLCADNSKINIYAKFNGEIRNSQSDAYFYDFQEKGGKREINVCKNSILNSPEPEM